MSTLTSFDVLIVYNRLQAESAADTPASVTSPFTQNGIVNLPLDTAYKYFLAYCKTSKLTVAFTTSGDISGPGTCRSYWLVRDNRWVKVKSSCASRQIFDKFSPSNNAGRATRDLLFSSKLVRPYNSLYLCDLFSDKQKTYAKLSRYAIPTVTIPDSALTSIQLACAKLTGLISAHENRQDFSQEIVMKDRFGAGGRHVYKFPFDDALSMQAVMLSNPQISFIIQPYTKFNTGFKQNGRVSAADIRLIYLRDRIVESYIRVAKKHDFRCNEHQGGKLSYLTAKEIPDQILGKSALIAAIIGKQQSLFTLDFIMSNSGHAYFLEGNTGPGLDWNINVKEENIRARKFIRLIVRDLSLNLKKNLSVKAIKPAQPSTTLLAPQTHFPALV